ncbi:Zinc finger, RING-type [Sesbania bispinosa]|nr:Zinc finger, RING-type [Sesbania bispinosa]
MELNHNLSYKLLYQALPPIKTQLNTIHHSPQPPLDSALPIFAIVVISILATSIILISYLTFVTKFCSNWHQINPLRWISNLRAQQNEDPFIAFSPRMWIQGLDESVIQEIPTFQFIKGEGGDDQSVYSCVVCLTEFQEQDMLKALPNCSHAFHLDCIDIWLQTNSNCPLCRSSISGNTSCPMDHIIAPSSSPQDSQLLSNMGNDEDFVVIELGRENGGTLPQIQRERNDSRESSRSHSTRKMEQKLMHLKPKKWHHVSIMGDECIDVRKKDDQFSIQPIRRSFSMDSANDRQVYLDVQARVQQNRHHTEASASEDCNSTGRRSFFPFCYGLG